MKLSERLAELRKACGYTLRELRDQIEQRTGERMSVSYLSELERLDMRPSVDVLTRMAAGYDISLQDLLAPVDFKEGVPEADYPPSLTKFVADRQLDSSWLDALSRIEYRGQRPDTPEDWETLYVVLRKIIAPKIEN